jgi:hypothetical protein
MSDSIVCIVFQFKRQFLLHFPNAHGLVSWHCIGDVVTSSSLALHPSKGLLNLLFTLAL